MSKFPPVPVTQLVTEPVQYVKVTVIIEDGEVTRTLAFPRVRDLFVELMVSEANWEITPSPPEMITMADCSRSTLFTIKGEALTDE